jgi:hypothetical protein
LLVATRLWARAWPLNDAALTAAQDRALLCLHRLHFETIPVYRCLALAADVKDVSDAGTLARELMVTNELFKSYDPDRLAKGDFAAMTAWLRSIFAGEPHVDLRGVDGMAAWRERLRQHGIFLTFSSATSGRVSLVPRDHATLAALRSNGVLSARAPARSAPDVLALTPKGMGLGIQSAARGIVEHAARVHRLDVLAGAGDDDWDGALRFLRTAAVALRPIIVLGTPPAIAELCARAEGLAVLHGADVHIVTGGGWKAQNSITPTELARRVERSLDVPASRLIDMYGAAELNFYLVRCPHDRYHVPPLVRAVALDEILDPLEGDDTTGLLGFLDPCALSYPGFVIPGDQGRLVRGLCPCGLHGWAVVGAITRAPAAGIRGCATAPRGELS